MKSCAGDRNRLIKLKHFIVRMSCFVVLRHRHIGDCFGTYQLSQGWTGKRREPHFTTALFVKLQKISAALPSYG